MTVAAMQIALMKVREPELQAKLVGSTMSGPHPSATPIPQMLELAEMLDALTSSTSRGLLRLLITQVELSETELSAEASFAPLGAADARFADLSALELTSFDVTAPLRLQRRGPKLRLILGGAAASAAVPDPMLLRTLIEARCRCADYLDPAREHSVSDIARDAGADVGDVSRSLQLAFPAPDLVEAILDGAQPVALTAQRLKRLDLPLLWQDQRAALG